MRTRDRQKFARRCRQVAEAIRTEPQRFRMNTVFGCTSADEDEYGDEVNLPLADWVKKAQSCGTTACIAGWALALNSKLIPAEVEDHEWDEIASGILGLPEAGRQPRVSITDPAYGLFYAMDITPEEAAERLDRIADEFEAGVRG
jgi:hypothetical protein